MKPPKSNILSLIIAVLLPLGVGGLGGWVTSSSVSTWYPTLKKPDWNPPAWVFGPVWTLLYLLMGIGSWLVWQRPTAQPERVRQALGWYGLQLGLNLLWSLLFFGRRRIDLALADIVALWSSLIVTLVKFAQISRTAAGLLAPYLLWTTFAAMLNTAIWRLNRDK